MKLKIFTSSFSDAAAGFDDGKVQEWRRVNDTPPARWRGHPPHRGDPPCGGWREAPGGVTFAGFIGSRRSR